MWLKRNMKLTTLELSMIANMSCTFCPSSKWRIRSNSIKLKWNSFKMLLPPRMLKSTATKISFSNLKKKTRFSANASITTPTANKTCASNKPPSPFRSLISSVNSPVTHFKKHPKKTRLLPPIICNSNCTQMNSKELFSLIKMLFKSNCKLLRSWKKKFLSSWKTHSPKKVKLSCWAVSFASMKTIWMAWWWKSWAWNSKTNGLTRWSLSRKINSLSWAVDWSDSPKQTLAWFRAMKSRKTQAQPVQSKSTLKDDKNFQLIIFHLKQKINLHKIDHSQCKLLWSNSFLIYFYK